MESGGQVRTTGTIPTDNAGTGSLLPSTPSVSVISEAGAVSVQTRSDASICTIENLEHGARHSDIRSVDTSLSVTPQYTTLDVPAPAKATDWTELFEGARFTHNGKYIAGHVESVDEIQKVIDNFRTLTSTNYLFKGSLPQTSIDEVALREKFMNASTRPRLLWQQHIGEPAVPYDGVPFISQGEYTEYSCVFMTKASRGRGKGEGDGSFMYMTAGGCNAKIFVRRILRFPSHRIADTSAYHGIAAIRRARKQVLEDLVNQICHGLVHPEERYCVSFPTSLAHTGHIISEFEEPKQGEMNPSFISQLIQLLNRRIVGLDEIHRSLHAYAEDNHGADLAINPNDPSLLPSRSCICRHIYWLYKTNQVTKTVDAVKMSKQMSRPRQNDYPQPSDAAVLDTSSTVPHSLYGIVMDTSGAAGSGHDVPDLSAEANTVEVQDTSLSNTGEEMVGRDELVYHENMSSLRQFEQTSLKQKENIQGHMGNSPSTTTTTTTKITTLSSDCTIEDDGDELSLAQQEVQSLLKIIENQLYACTDCSAMHKLRRQLTTLCTQFSAGLSGGRKRGLNLNDSHVHGAKTSRLM